MAELGKIVLWGILPEHLEILETFERMLKELGFEHLGRHFYPPKTKEAVLRTMGLEERDLLSFGGMDEFGPGVERLVTMWYIMGKGFEDVLWKRVEELVKKLNLSWLGIGHVYPEGLEDRVTKELGLLERKRELKAAVA